MHTFRKIVGRYDRLMAPVYDLTRWPFLFDRSLAVQWLGLRPGDAALEVGVGTGLNLCALVRSVGPSGSVVGIDGSPTMLRRADRRVRRHHWRNVYLFCEDAASFAVQHTFQAALFSYTLSMVRDPEHAIDCALAHLSPGGRIGILDFGPFTGWGFMTTVARQWLAWNHVTMRQGDLTALGSRIERLKTVHKRGGYNLVAVGIR